MHSNNFVHLTQIFRAVSRSSYSSTIGLKILITPHAHQTCKQNQNNFFKYSRVFNDSIKNAVKFKQRLLYFRFKSMQNQQWRVTSYTVLFGKTQLLAKVHW